MPTEGTQPLPAPSADASDIAFALAALEGHLRSNNNDVEAEQCLAIRKALQQLNRQ